MATHNSTAKGGKSVQDDMEDKSLEQAAVAPAGKAPKAPDADAEAEQAGEEKVTVVASHPLRAGVVRDEPVEPGTAVQVTKDRARELTRSGAARYA